MKTYEDKIQEYQPPPQQKPIIVYEPPIEVVQQTYELPPQASSSRVKQEAIASPQYEFIFEDHIEEVSENEAAAVDEDYMDEDYMVEEIEEVKMTPARHMEIKEEVKVECEPILFMEPAKVVKLVEPTKHIRRTKVKIEVKPDLAGDSGDFTYKFAKPAGKPMDFQCHLCPKQFSKVCSLDNIFV